MKIILAGYPKTGTKSMCAALSVLGYKNTYDFIENMWYFHKEWNRIYHKGGTADDFRKMFQDVDSVCDTPCIYYWEQLVEAFPDAKIILTVRDDASWYESWQRQAQQLSKSYFLWAFLTLTPSGLMRRKFRYHALKFLGDIPDWPSSTVVPHSDLVLLRMYREHNAYVQQKAPQDKLLVFRVTEGWQPLCEFLGVDVPDQPFPHKNKNASVVEDQRRTHEISKRIQREVLTCLTLLSVCTGFCVYKSFRAWPSIKPLACQHLTLINNWFQCRFIGS